MDEEKNSFLVDGQDEACWVCRTCGRESEYSVHHQFTPAKWEDSKVLGLRCPFCIKNKVLPT